MLDVLLDLASVQRLQPEASRHALLELPQLRAGEQRLQIGLPDEDDLEQRAALVVDVREQADLLEDVRLQMLSLVDDDDRMRLDRGQRAEKRLQRLDEIVTARLGESGSILRDDAKILEHLLQKVVAFEHADR